MQKLSAGATGSMRSSSAVNRGYCVRCSYTLLGCGARWYFIIVNSRTYYVSFQY